MQLCTFVARFSNVPLTSTKLREPTIPGALELVPHEGLEEGGRAGWLQHGLGIPPSGLLHLFQGTLSFCLSLVSLHLCLHVYVCVGGMS